MQADELRTLFDQQASQYDQQWSRLAALRDALHLLIGATLTALPDDARILCVGAGTGSEILYLGERFPGWTFTVVEPSGAMVEVCRQRTAAQGMAPRCTFHTGYLDALPTSEPFQAATCLLVSQFMLVADERTAFFRQIAERLAPGGVLVSADLSSDVKAPGHDSLMAVWMRLMGGAGISPDNIARMREAYAKDVAILPPTQVEALIGAAGFHPPIGLFQGGLIRAWYALSQ